MSPLRRLLTYALKYKREFSLGLLAAVLTQAVVLAGPRILQYAVDDLTVGVTRRKLLMYGLLLIGVGLVSGVFRFLQRQILVGASRHIEYDIRNDFFAHLETLPLAYFHAHRTGDLMSRGTNDLNSVRMMIGPSVMYTANTVLSFFTALTLMFIIDPYLTMLSLVPLPFVSLSVWRFGSIIHRRSEEIQAKLADISAIVQEALSGVRVVRAYLQEDAELERFRRANLEYVDRNRRLVLVQGLFFPCMSFFFGLASMFVLWIGGQQVIRGRITLGEFVAFNSYLMMLAWPMVAFGWVTNIVQRGMASWKRIVAVLDVAPAIADSPHAVSSTERVRGDVEFRNLTFAYNGTPVLTNISARIPAGQTVALVGGTGSGKSTLVTLLARLHDPPPGTVFVDGIDVRETPLARLRSAIGFVPQEPFLFSDTLADNVAFGLDRAGRAGTAGGAGRDEKIAAAAAIARLDKDVADFPDGYATRVGERGITLSGGQKQRTAIARAVIIDPSILILDDALSAVDTYTEEEILARLREVMKRRTSIIVSHRISTVKDADQIFVLDAGAIVERGTHDELISRGGIYAELHKKQLLEEELAAS